MTHSDQILLNKKPHCGNVGYRFQAIKLILKKNKKIDIGFLTHLKIVKLKANTQNTT